MPGAQLQEIEGDEYRGIVKVKVGPITAQYKGAARFLERDEAAHKAVLRAEGRDTRGQGNANATITATLTPDGDGTAVTVVTDLTVTGRVAQFGRGVMADVSTKLLGQFVDCLEGKLLADGRPASAPAAARGRRPRHRAPARGRRHGPLDIASEGARRRARPRRGRRGRGGDGDPAAAQARLNGTSGPAVKVVDCPGGRAGRPARRRRRPGGQAGLAPAVVGLTVLWLLSVFLRPRRRRRNPELASPIGRRAPR